MKKVLFLPYMLMAYVLSVMLTNVLLLPGHFGVYLYALVTIPGTVCHELAHFTFAYILGGDPQGFSLIPTIDGDIITLGSVMFYPGPVNAATAGYAPLILITFVWYFIERALRGGTLLTQALWLWAAASAWNSCLPSSFDRALSAEYPTSVPLAFLFLGGSMILIFMVLKRTLRA